MCIAYYLVDCFILVLSFYEQGVFLNTPPPPATTLAFERQNIFKQSLAHGVRVKQPSLLTYFKYFHVFNNLSSYIVVYYMLSKLRFHCISVCTYGL